MVIPAVFRASDPRCYAGAHFGVGIALPHVNHARSLALQRGVPRLSKLLVAASNLAGLASLPTA